MKKKKRRGARRQETTLWRSPRQPLRPLAEDHALVLEISARVEAYQRAAESTKIGQRAVALCSRARQLGERGNPGAAHQLYLQAASLFTSDDTSAGAAWCWHCLAESFLSMPSGVRRENLQEAATLYRRALASPDRQQEPYRYSMTQNGLSRCLRDRAAMLPASPARERMLDEAKALLVQACATTVRTGLFGWSWAVQHLHNLGKLCLQREEIDEAIEALEECCRHLEALERYPLNRHDISPEEIPWYKANSLYAVAEARMRRFRPDDRRRIEHCLQQVIESGHPPSVDVARMLRARFYLRRGASYRTHAVAELDKVIVERLPDHALLGLANVLEEAGLSERASAVLRKGLHDALDQRTHAMADHAADYHAGEALPYAIGLARLHVETQEPVNAFLVLEQVAGNRYFDQVTNHGWRPRDPITHHLYEQMRRHGSMAAILDDLAGSIAGIPGDQDARRQLLDRRGNVRSTMNPEVLELHSKEERDRAYALAAEIDDLIRRAMDEPVPAAFLREHARRFARECHRYRTCCIARDPEFGSTRKPWMYRMTVAGLETIAREHPEHAFVRIHLLDELLVTAIWWDGTSLVGRALRMAIPGGYQGLREALEADPNASSAAQELLEQIDISPALPPQRMKHGVLLPSLLAARVPLAALGPRGCTPLDHFDEISWLPTLTPLWMRQAPSRPRLGTLLVVPGDTRYHAIASKTGLDDETVLQGTEATLPRVLERAAGADVVSFYTHGRHESELGPGIQLHDGARLDSFHPSDRYWAGMERVEIWACESGVDLPLDPRTPLVDEAFGFDALFHHWGVRSTIASLWKVPDLVTACIVDRYRQGLMAGLSAPHALASAQRWWRDEGISVLRYHLTRMPEREAIESFVSFLGMRESVPDLDAVLGPVQPARPAAQRVEELVRRLGSPRSWAGLRFLGVAERRPAEPWNPEWDRPLSDAERAELGSLLAESAHPSGWDREGDIETLASGESPDPERALAMARAYRERAIGAARHNVLRGLAWLHEAMMADDLERSRWLELAIEAAWMWLDLARCEAIHLPDVVLRPVPPALLQRVQRLLADMGARALAPTVETRAIRAWVELLAQCGRAGGAADDLMTALAAARARAAALVTEVDPGSWRSVRALGELMDLAALAPGVPAPLAESLLAPLDRIDDWNTIPEGVASRVLCAAAVLCRFASMPPRYAVPPAAAMTHRNVVRDSFTAIAADNLAHVESERPDAHRELPRHAKRARDEDLSWLDHCYWDYPDSAQVAFWKSTGTPGSAHRAAISSYIEGQIKGPYGAELASQMLWSLQRLCDLRLVRLHLWARLSGWPDGEEEQAFWYEVRTREHLLELLDDASQVAPIPGDESHARGLTRCDPFATATDDILAASFGATSDILDTTAWCLANENRDWREDDDQPAATVAFHTEHLLKRLDRQIDEMGAPLHEKLRELDFDTLRREAPELLALEEPYIDLEVIEPMLRALPEGWIVIGLAVAPSGSLVGAATMKLGGRFLQHAYCSPGPDGFGVAVCLEKLLRPQTSDFGLERGMSADRRESWEGMRDAMEPLLDALLPAELPSAPQLCILAPGSLRALPWSGLCVRGQPLHRLFHSIRLLPALGFLQNVDITSAARGPKHACLLAENPPERSEGEMRFGAAAVQTLRAWFAPDVTIEPRAPVHGSDVVEVDAIGSVDHELASLRMYGVAAMAPNLNTSTSGLSLSGGRILLHHNTRTLKLPACECVELWAATGREGAAAVALQNDRDRIPGLAWSFLSCGAAGVVDLAWPVHDLVKALVCEHFGILRHGERQPAAVALRHAIDWTASTLDVWRNALGGCVSVASALASLDDLRRHEAQRRGLRSAAVQPFAEYAGVPCAEFGSVQELIEEVCQPVHLAAFRYWGA